MISKDQLLLGMLRNGGALACTTPNFFNYGIQFDSGKCLIDRTDFKQVTFMGELLDQLSQEGLIVARRWGYQLTASGIRIAETIVEPPG